MCFRFFHVRIPIHSHRIHGAGIYTNIGGILMVNVTIYSIHGSYGSRRYQPIVGSHLPWPTGSHSTENLFGLNGDSWSSATLRDVTLAP